MQHHLSILFTRMRLAAQAKKHSSELLRLRCHNLASLTKESIMIWHQGESGTSSPAQERSAEKVANFWSDVLFTSYMNEGAEYLRTCTWYELQGHVLMVRAIFTAAGRGDETPDLLARVTLLRESIMTATEAALRPVQAPLPLPPPATPAPARKTAEIISLKMFRANRT